MLQTYTKPIVTLYKRKGSLLKISVLLYINLIPYNLYINISNLLYVHLNYNLQVNLSFYFKHQDIILFKSGGKEIGL